MATGVYAWSKTAASNSSADSNVNWAEGQAPSSVNDSARAEMASVAKWRDDISGTLTTGGTSTAFTLTTNCVFASASEMDGAMICFIPHTTNGASPTLAVDGLTARNINVSPGVSVATGALVEGTPYVVTYDNDNTEFLLQGTLGNFVLTSVDINGATSLTGTTNLDEMAIYDADASANKTISISNLFKIINVFTADASPSGAIDYVVTYDASASAPKKVLLQNMPANTTVTAAIDA